MVSVISPRLCIRCKGKLWCGLKYCPILVGRRMVKSIQLSKEMDLYSHSLFVGWRGYPKVRVAPVLSPEILSLEEPPVWVSKDMDIGDILSLRMKTGQGYREVNVREGVFLDIVLSRKPVNTHVEFMKEPRPSISFSSVFPPTGYRAPLRYLSVEDNVRWEKWGEKMYYDEVKAKEGVITLYEKGLDVYRISNYLSAGVLGVKKKLVPTRWSITAVDSILSSYLLSKVGEYPEIDSIYLYHSHLFDNHFYIIFIPSPWSFELIESWAPKTPWGEVISMDGEYGRERKTYASNVGGSYYATKLAVLEKLYKIKRSAAVVVLREVREGYYAPLGVWQVRENVRNALRSKPLVFNTLKEVIDFVESQTRTKNWRKYSKLLQGIQKRLF